MKILAAMVAAVVAVGCIGAAQAAPASPFNWTGFYIGGTVGVGFSRANVSLNTVNGAAALYDPAQIPGLNALGSPGFSQTNAIFGGKIGYNQQWGSYVLGLEGDFSWFRFNQSGMTTGNPFDVVLPPATVNFATFNTNVSTSWLATVRPRLGYAIGQALYYGSAGVALANVSFSNSYLGHSGMGAGNESESSAASQTRTGWAAGAGIDYALTANWIVSIEYLHVDLGSLTTSGLVTTGNANTATMNFSTKLRSEIVRGGISYKF